MSPSVTLADANILISRTIRDYVVYAANVGALQIHWSPSILDETSRNLNANDRHALAAALSANADVLLTDNTRHFPREWMAKRYIELVDSTTLLTRMATEHPRNCARRIG